MAEGPEPGLADWGGGPTSFKDFFVVVLLSFLPLLDSVKVKVDRK